MTESIVVNVILCSEDLSNVRISGISTEESEGISSNTCEDPPLTPLKYERSTGRIGMARDCGV